MKKSNGSQVKVGIRVVALPFLFSEPPRNRNFYLPKVKIERNGVERSQTFKEWYADEILGYIKEII
jgi:hypothetical protein